MHCGVCSLGAPKCRFGAGYSLVVDVNAVVFMLHRWRRVRLPGHVITRLGIVTSGVGRQRRDGVVWEVRPG